MAHLHTSEEHHHHHDHAPKSLENISTAFYIGIGLNILFTLVEFIFGYIYDSLALLSDATHNLSDVASLILALIGMKLAKRSASEKYTYGYKKASLLASLINAVLLVVVVVGIVYEAFHRLSNPVPLGGSTIIWVASIGVIINTVSAFLFFKGQKDDINVKGAFLHLLIDALVSVGVVVAGAIIYFTGWTIVDPLISFVIAIIIFASTWGILNESIRLVLDGVPSSIKLDEVKKAILAIPNIETIHHLHVWALSSTENAITIHVVLKDYQVDTWEHIKKEIRHELTHHQIHHATIELDTDDTHEAKECTK